MIDQPVRKLQEPRAKATQRPTGVSKRLTTPERLLIKAEQGTENTARSVADKYGVHESTVSRIWNNEKLNLYKNEVQTLKDAMADQLYITAHRSIKQVNDKLEATSASQAAVIAGIMIDKARLLTNESTQNISHNVFLDAINNVPVDEGFDK